MKCKGSVHLSCIRDVFQRCGMVEFSSPEMRPIFVIQCKMWDMCRMSSKANVIRGGLGLTGGLSDIGSLIDCFYGILDKTTKLDILDKWCEMRRKIYDEYINPVSTTNMERILNDPADMKDTDPLFQTLRQADHDRALFADLQWVSLCRKLPIYRLTRYQARAVYRPRYDPLFYHRRSVKAYARRGWEADIGRHGERQSSRRT